MLIDSRIIHCHARTDVLAQRHAVMWPDGSSLWLHTVRLSGDDAPLLRALQVDGTWALLDLSRALPTLADDMRVQPKRDGVGLVYYALRARWSNAAAFVDRMRPHLQALQAPALAVPEAA